jgi:hypothetical protein
MHPLLPVFVALSAFAVTGSAEPPPMKTIAYRGGIITFRIPADWKEEYQPEGGGMFYSERPGAGTLRLNVLTFEAPPGKLATDGYSYFRASSLAPGERLIKMALGDGLKVYKKEIEEEKTKLDMYCWTIAHCAPPKKFYLANFTWVILRSQSSDPTFQKEIEFLTEEISQAHFHPGLGNL